MGQGRKKVTTTINDLVLKVYRKMVVEKNMGHLKYRLTLPHDRAAFYTGFSTGHIRMLAHLAEKPKQKV